MVKSVLESGLPVCFDSKCVDSKSLNRKVDLGGVPLQFTDGELGGPRDNSFRSAWSAHSEWHQMCLTLKSSLFG